MTKPSGSGDKLPTKNDFIILGVGGSRYCALHEPLVAGVQS